MKRIHWITLGVIGLASFAGELFGPHDPAHTGWWTGIPFFYALFGFVGCVIIVVFSKWLGKIGLQQKEGYYDRG